MQILAHDSTLYISKHVVLEAVSVFSLSTRGGETFAQCGPEEAAGSNGKSNGKIPKAL
jgi:hypothetical protein